MILKNENAWLSRCRASENPSRRQKAALVEAALDAFPGEFTLSYWGPAQTSVETWCAGCCTRAKMLGKSYVWPATICGGYAKKGNPLERG
jgi:hypothetical protein